MAKAASNPGAKSGPPFKQYSLGPRESPPRRDLDPSSRFAAITQARCRQTYPTYVTETSTAVNRHPTRSMRPNNYRSDCKPIRLQNLLHKHISLLKYVYEISKRMVPSSLQPKQDLGVKVSRISADRRSGTLSLDLPPQASDPPRKVTDPSPQT